MEYEKLMQMHIGSRVYRQRSRGEDIRAIVVGDKVVASMKRKAKARRFQFKCSSWRTVQKNIY